MRISDDVLARTGLALGGLSVLMGAGGILVLLVRGNTELLMADFALHNGLLGIGFGAVVWLIAGNQPRNMVVWVLAGAAFCTGLYAASDAALAVIASAQNFDISLDAVRDLSPATAPNDFALVIALSTWAWLPGFFLPLTLGLLLFPDGRLPSRRWRWVAYAAGALLIVTTAAMVTAFLPGSHNLYGTEDFADFEGIAGTLGVTFPALMLVSVACAASLFFRYRASSDAERRQIRWIAWAGSALVLTLAVGFVISGATESDGVFDLLALAGIVLLPTSFGVAILKYRLYDIDLVISKTVTYGALAVFIAAVYAAVVVGIGSLFDKADEPNLWLSIGAIGIIAVLFEPIHSRVRRLAGRLVYGERATPYSVLSQLSTQFSTSTASEDGLAELAEVVAGGTGAAMAGVWVRVGEKYRRSAVWPPVDEQTAATPVQGVEIEDLGLELAVPVVDGEDVVGAIGIDKARSDPVTEADRHLLSDVAAGATLLLRNIRLNTELAERAEQLRASRRRLMAAHDSERHRLERDLHDGAQQQVVALKVKLGLAKAIAEREGATEVAGLVSSLADGSQQVVDAMRVVARGIYPPLLEAEGLGPALAAVQRLAPIPLDVAVDGIGRYPRHIEETVYFCVMETIEGATQSGAKGLRVDLSEDTGDLVIEILHDGRAAEDALTAVSDRVDAFGGTTEISLLSGGGTRIISRLPAARQMVEAT